MTLRKVLVTTYKLRLESPLHIRYFALFSQGDIKLAITKKVEHRAFTNHIVSSSLLLFIT